MNGLKSHGYVQGVYNACKVDDSHEQGADAGNCQDEHDIVLDRLQLDSLEIFLPTDLVGILCLQPRGSVVLIEEA